MTQILRVNMKFQSGGQPFIQKGDMDAIIDLVIKCVKDENNAPAFTLKDKPVLKRKADFTILSRIVGEIMDVPEVEELEKN